MALKWFGGSKNESIADLIARRKYSKAIEMLRARFVEGSREPQMRSQLADILIMAGREKEAVPILIGIADEYALDGFAAKSIAVLKRIDKIQPGRADVYQRLARLILAETPPPSSSEPVALAPPPEPEPDREADVLDLDTIQAAEETAAGNGGPRPEPPPMTDEDFEEELLEVIEEVSVPDPPEVAYLPPHPIVASELFGDFSQDELLAVIRGLELVTFEPGDVIITEGEPGDSLFILTTGVVKAFVKNPLGRHVQVREMSEGAFFGEISILSGQPRTATVTAAARCEVLELDRKTLDSIVAAHPRVLGVLEDFYEQRAMSAGEAQVRQMSPGEGGRQAR